MGELASDGQMMWHEAVAAKLAEMLQWEHLRDDQGSVNYRNIGDFAYDVANHYWLAGGKGYQTRFTFWADVADAAYERAKQSELAADEAATREVAYLERLFAL